MPILANALISGDGQDLEISTTDLEVFFSGKWRAKVAEKGTVCVNAAALSRILDAMPKGGELVLAAAAKHGLEIRQGKTRYELFGDDPGHFPPVATLFNPTADTVTLDARVIHEMITKTRFSICSDTLQHHLNGIFWETIKISGRTSGLMPCPVSDTCTTT